MNRHPMLANIPHELLDPSSRATTSGQRARALEQWCVSAGFRPTLADIAAERKRRGIR